MSDQDLFDRVHRNHEDVEVWRPSSPARPLEPYDAFQFLVDGQQLLGRRQSNSPQQHISLSEPSPPAAIPTVSYNAVEQGPLQHQYPGPRLSAPSSPKLAWDVWNVCNVCQGSLSDGEFLDNRLSAEKEGSLEHAPYSLTSTEDTQAQQGNLSDGEFLNDLKLAKNEPVPMTELEYDFAFLGNLSDGEFLDGARRADACPSPPLLRVLPTIRRIGAYDSLELQGTLSDGVFYNNSWRSLDMAAASSPPVLKADMVSCPNISPTPEQNDFEGYLSDGEFWNSRSYLEQRTTLLRGASLTASELRGGATLSPLRNQDLEELMAPVISMLSEKKEVVGTRSDELAHRHKRWQEALTVESPASLVIPSPVVSGRQCPRLATHTVGDKTAAQSHELADHSPHGSEMCDSDEEFRLPPPLLNTHADPSIGQPQEHIERL